MSGYQTYDDPSNEQLISQSEDEFLLSKQKSGSNHESKMYRSLIFSFIFLVFGLIVFLCVVILLIALIFFVNPKENVDIPVRYALVGDWGREGKFYQSDVAKRMSDFCTPNSKEASFIQLGCKEVISLGDNLYEYGVSTDDAPEFQLSFENIYKPYQMLNIPWRIIYGNHDYKRNPFAQISYANKENTLWVTEGNGLYYAHNNDIPFVPLRTIFIDTVPMLTQYWDPQSGINHTALTPPEAQLVWLESELKKAQEDKVIPIVMGHHPVYCVSDKEPAELADMQRSIETLLVRYNVPVYICGHEHNLQHIPIHYDKDGKPILNEDPAAEVKHSIQYIISGGGSSTRPIPEEHVYKKHLKYGYPEGGFVGMSVFLDKIDFTFITYQGNAEHSFSIPIVRN